MVGNNTLMVKPISIWATGSSMDMSPNLRRMLRMIGMVMIEQKLPKTQMNRLNGILPNAIAVITVPEATVTGAAPMIKTPTAKSGQLPKNNCPRK